jgi:glycerophosphoryl diester phosphodiesterase
VTARWVMIACASISLSMADEPSTIWQVGQLGLTKAFFLAPHTAAELQSIFSYSTERLKLVSAHRGGARPGFPENCIESFEDTLKYGYSLIEVDPRYTKDGHIVIHHDARLERTTNGFGVLAEKTLAELKALRLKDPQGTVTDFTIPTLDEVVAWSRGKTILVLDQKDVPTVVRAECIAKHHAESHVLLIVSKYSEVKACYEKFPNIMMEVFMTNHAKVAEFDQIGVPWKNIIAFVGHDFPTDRTLYEKIHSNGARCMVGTSRNLDRKILDGHPREMESLRSHYQELLDLGADVIETDIPTLLNPILHR